jgi:hypothetical protein
MLLQSPTKKYILFHQTVYLLGLEKCVANILHAFQFQQLLTSLYTDAKLKNAVQMELSFAEK